MSKLDAQQIADLRADIGDSQNSFSDDELQRLHVRSGYKYDKTVLMALDQLLSNSAKFSDYTQGQSSEKQSQIFEHVRQIREMWSARVAESSRRKTRFVAITGGTRKMDKPEGF